MSYTSAIRDPLRYGFAVGRVRVLETRLLKRSHYERLLDAADFDEQRRILSETGYGAYLEGAVCAEDVEQAFDRALADLQRDFLGSANLPEAVVAFFRVREDYDELRGLLKAEALGLPAAELLSGAGSISAEDFATGRLPAPLAEALRTIRSQASDEDGELRIELIDPVVDAALYHEIAALAAQSRNEYMRELARVSADLVNVKVFVRTRVKGLTVADAQRFFVDGGTIPHSRLVSLFRLPAEEAASRLVASGPLRGIDPEALFDPGRFDVVADTVIVRQLRRARMVAVGPEPVVAYILLRRAEIATVRTLLIGKLAGVSRDVLRSRLRDVG
ncbi:MAG: V-type ATPase subunit [Coriobacteriia bacterium]|nr:V-type ATPase subunit [Coriobacteriia bacterium]